MPVIPYDKYSPEKYVLHSQSAAHLSFDHPPPGTAARVGRAQLYRLSLVDAHTVAQNQYTGQKCGNIHLFCHGIVLCTKVRTVIQCPGHDAKQHPTV